MVLPFKLLSTGLLESSRLPADRYSMAFFCLGEARGQSKMKRTRKKKREKMKRKTRDYAPCMSRVTSSQQSMSALAWIESDVATIITRLRQGILSRG